MSVYSYLGPAGTFTEAALIPLLKPEDKSVPAVNVTAALDAVRSGTADYAIVPIENSVEGVVARTLDELASGDPLLIIGESILAVSFALMVKPGVKISDIKRLATHPHAEAQCREYIAKNIPGAEVIMTASTAAGAEAVAIAEDVGDRQAAVTRFVTVSRPGKIAPPTGSDRSSLVVFIDADHSGALLEILTEFAVRGVNLTFIQSRPNGVELGQYHFIIDVEGHIEDARVGDTLKALYRICADVRFLGSYARADKVLPTLNKSTEDKAFDTAENWLTRIRSGEIKK